MINLKCGTNLNAFDARNFRVQGGVLKLMVNTRWPHWPCTFCIMVIDLASECHKGCH